MAVKKHTRKRQSSTKTKVSTLTRKQLDSVGFDCVTIYSPQERNTDLPADDFPKFFRFPVATRFEFGWEFENADGDTEHLFAKFDGKQLLQAAMNLGNLRETFEGERRVPKGKLPPMQEPNFHRKLALKTRKSKSA